MYLLRREFAFSASHRLHLPGSPCDKIHGHNWQVAVTVRGSELHPEKHMLFDFARVKAIVMERFDHADLNAALLGMGGMFYTVDCVQPGRTATAPVAASRCLRSMGEAPQPTAEVLALVIAGLVQSEINAEYNNQFQTNFQPPQWPLVESVQITESDGATALWVLEE